MLVDHHMDLVMSVCDRVVVLDFGGVIAAGAPEQISRTPGWPRRISAAMRRTLTRWPVMLEVEELRTD